MKKIKTIAACITILMLIPLVFGFINSIWFIEPIVKEKLSDKQIDEICSKFKFEIELGENMYIEYWPTVIQATTYLKVYVENIQSEADFISRFHGDVIAKKGSTSVDGETYFNSYDIKIIQSNRIPKDYACTLQFTNDSGSLKAMFYISGYFSELKSIYAYFNFNLRPFLINPTFMIPFIIEAVLIIIILILVFYENAVVVHKSQV